MLGGSGRSPLRSEIKAWYLKEIRRCNLWRFLHILQASPFLYWNWRLCCPQNTDEVFLLYFRLKIRVNHHRDRRHNSPFWQYRGHLTFFRGQTGNGSVFGGAEGRSSNTRERPGWLTRLSNSVFCASVLAILVPEAPKDVYFSGLSLDVFGDASWASEEWITSRFALYTKACRSAPENPSVNSAISESWTVGPRSILWDMTFKIWTRYHPDNSQEYDSTYIVTLLEVWHVTKKRFVQATRTKKSRIDEIWSTVESKMMVTCRLTVNLVAART